MILYQCLVCPITLGTDVMETGVDSTAARGDLDGGVCWAGVAKGVAEGVLASGACAVTNGELGRSAQRPRPRPALSAPSAPRCRGQQHALRVTGRVSSLSSYCHQHATRATGSWHQHAMRVTSYCHTHATRATGSWHAMRVTGRVIWGRVSPPSSSSSADTSQRASTVHARVPSFFSPPFFCHAFVGSGRVYSRVVATAGHSCARS